MSSVLHGGVGPGDFDETGRETVRIIRIFAGLGTEERVLDVGCGVGRVASALWRELGNGVSYDGLDVVPSYIDWCRNELELDPSRFRFTLAEVRNSMYNPDAPQPAEEFRFPWPDRTFTLTIATSLFTHLSAAVTVNYLREIYRTLAPGGRLFASFFVLDSHSRESLRTGVTDPEFTTEFEQGLLTDVSNPDAAVAFDVDWLHRVFLDIGFQLDVYEPGMWRRTHGYTYQDMVVARRK